MYSNNREYPKYGYRNQINEDEKMDAQVALRSLKMKMAGISPPKYSDNNQNSRQRQYNSDYNNNICNTNNNYDNYNSHNINNYYTNNNMNPNNAIQNNIKNNRKNRLNIDNEIINNNNYDYKPSRKNNNQYNENRKIALTANDTNNYHDYTKNNLKKTKKKSPRNYNNIYNNNIYNNNNENEDNRPIGGGMTADQIDEADEITKPCPHCGRSFNQNAFNKHVKICQKVFQKKRKVFNTQKQRINDYEQASLMKQGAIEEKRLKKINKNKQQKIRKWKQQSMEFRAICNPGKNNNNFGKNNIMKNNNDVITSSYIHCQYCDRKYNEEAYNKHLNGCKRRYEEALIKKGGKKNVNKKNVNIQYGYGKFRK